MRHIILASVMIMAGAFFAGYVGTPIVIVGCIGAALGSLLFAAIRKSQLIGAITGVILSIIAFAIIGFGGGKSVRCEFGDPVDYPPLDHPAGYVYVIQDVDISRYFKIGRTIDPSRRLSEFKVILPFETEIVAIVETDNAPILENDLHRRYASALRRGEWYALGDNQVREICNL